MPHVLLLLGLAGLALLVVVGCYLIAPFAIIDRQTTDIEIQVEGVEESDLPPGVSHVFVEAHRSLIACGFQALGVAAQAVKRTDQRAFMALWMNVETRDSSQVVGVLTPSPSGDISAVTLVTFRTEFTNMTTIITTNAEGISCWPPDPRASTIRCPGIHDLALLYRFHRSRVERECGCRIPTLEHCNDPTSRLKWEHRDSFQSLCVEGYYRIDVPTRSYVPTVRGAFLMTYRLLPPFNQIQRMRRNRAATLALRPFGFASLRKFRAAQQPSPPRPPFAARA